MSSQHPFLDEIPAYALDCLSHDETFRMAEHLSACEICQAELDAYRQVVDQIYLAAPEAAPRSALKQKLTRRLSQERALPGRSRPEQARGRWWEGFRDLFQAQTAGQARRAAPAFAGVFLVALLAASNLWLLWRVNRLEAATSPNFRVVVLTGTDKAPAASGMLVMNEVGEAGTLVVDRLPPLDANRQYQLWLIQDAKRINGGVFSVSHDGYGTLAIYTEQPLNSFSAFGITEEPAGGSPGPTGDKVLGGNL